MRKGSLLTYLCLLLGVATVAVGQVQTGSITGLVKDPAGAVIPGATVTATNMQTNVATKTTTRANGSYTIAGLPFGTYHVTVEMDGFRKWETLNVRVVTAQDSIVNAELVVGSVSEVVTVEAGQEVLSTVSTEIQSNISKKEITDLPLLGRDPTQLVGLQAGATNSSGSVRGSNFNGMRGTTVNLTQDGINAMDNFVKTSGVFALNSPTVESTGEFSISTSNIGSDAGFGQTQIRLTTERGTNEYHGTLFYFHRNDKLNAAEFFDNIDGRKPDGTPVTPKEREREHRFGGAVGGPLYIPGLVDQRENTFWFFRYEGFRENSAVNRNRTVLTSTARQGLYTYIARSAGTHPQTGVPFNTGDPVTVDLLSLSSRGFGLNPFTMSLINATPLPNNVQAGDCQTDARLAAGLCNTGGHRFAVVGSDEINRYAFRADQKIVESESYGTHWAEVVYSWVSFDSSPDLFNGLEAEFPEGVAQSCVGGVCEGAGQFSQRKLFAAAIHSTFGATFFNEVRFGFNRAPVGFLRDNPFPRDFRIDFDSFQSPEQNFLSQGRQTPVYQFNENATKVAGSHTIKFGGQIMSVSGISFNDGGIINQIEFDENDINSHGLLSSSLPGAGSSDRTRARNIYEALVGLLGSANQSFNGTPGQSTFTPGASNELWLRERSFSTYLMDTWRVRSNLTLNLGLRWEVIRPVDVVNKRAVAPVGGDQGVFVSGPLFSIDPSVTFADYLNNNVVPPQLEAAGTSNGVPFWGTDWNNLAPFAGFAWSVNPKTVIRAGGSISYTREGLTLVSGALGSNTGLRQSLTDDVLSGVLDPASVPTIAAPPLRLPFNQIENFINSSGGAGFFTFNRNFRTPYVIQWSFGIQRELSPSMALEVRYVGNHGVKLARAIDFNQIDIIGNGLLSEFALAQQNLACNGGASFENLGTPCNVAMPIIDALSLNHPLIDLHQSSSLLTDLDRNQAGQFWHSIQLNCTFFRFAFDGALGSLGNICPGLDAMPANFFRANPFGTFMDVTGNNSTSSYHGLQVEVRRRFASGLMFNANYTFAKALTDFSGDVQNEFEPILDLRQPDFDRRRAGFDVRHHFNFSGVFDIPVGRGRRYASEGVIGKVLEGWQLGAINRWRSGAPFGIYSSRGTLNRNGRSSNRNTAVLLTGTLDDVCNAVGIYKEDDGVFLLPPEFRENGGAATTTLFAHPGAGQLGTQALRAGCSRTGYFQLDLNLLKRTYFTESANVEFRFEVFNVLNHPNFQPEVNNAITDTNFSRIDSLTGTGSRQIQVNIRINF